MKKIISYSLFGNQSKYWYGALCNIQQAKIIYPDWICRIYYNNSVPVEAIDEMKQESNVELVDMTGIEDFYERCWRFLAIDDDDVEIMICRDADSRLSWREKTCVDIFIESDKLLHSIRDNISHNNIMAGMWGLKKNNRVIIRNLLDGFGDPPPDPDQVFLREKVIPQFEDSYLIHCSSYLNNFPVKKENERFVGEVWHDFNWGKEKDYIWF